MEENIERKFKWFWAWQDEKEESWLEDMSRHGLHLRELGVLGWYYFQRGEPGEYAYRMDFNNTQKNRSEYLQLFQDAGWQHCGRLGGWDYFRKQHKPGEVMEIYSDRESKIQKYNRLLISLIIFIPIMIVLLTSNRGEDEMAIYELARMLGLVLLVLYSIALIKIMQRMIRLKNG
jgi:hypothetical protein